MEATWEFELPLAVALLKEAVERNLQGYMDMLGFWWDIQQRFGDDDAVLADQELVLLLPYLNRTLSDFNPWVALRETSSTLPLPIDWNDMEQAAGGDAIAVTLLSKLKRRLDASRQLAPRVVFCRAMSMLFLNHANPASLSPHLGATLLPARGRR